MKGYTTLVLPGFGESPVSPLSLCYHSRVRGSSWLWAEVLVQAPHWAPSGIISQRGEGVPCYCLPRGLHWHFGMVLHCLILSHSSWILCSVFPLYFILLFQFGKFPMTCLQCYASSQDSAQSTGDLCLIVPTAVSWLSQVLMIVLPFQTVFSCQFIDLIIFRWKLDKLYSTIKYISNFLLMSGDKKAFLFIKPLECEFVLI